MGVFWEHALTLRVSGAWSGLSGVKTSIQKWRRKVGDDAVCERRGRGQRERLAPHKGHWRGRALRLFRRAKEVKRNCTERSGGWRRRRHGRRWQRVRFA
eukprot:4265888-Pleurochrysis_carterae.AAC.1